MQSRTGGPRPSNQGSSRAVRWAIFVVTVLVKVLLGFVTYRLGPNQLQPVA
jgi:hypothetical protein